MGTDAFNPDTIKRLVDEAYQMYKTHNPGTSERRLRYLACEFVRLQVLPELNDLLTALGWTRSPHSANLDKDS